MKPEYYFPVKPAHINRPWGFYDPKDYSQFGFTNHNGVDWAPGIDKTYRYPWNGTGTVVRTGNQPHGGGIFLGILSNEVFDFPDGKQAKILTDALHAERLLLNEGDQVKTGDPCIIQDNTGFSTGPHTHEQCRRMTTDSMPGHLMTIDVNDANNSFDQTIYETGGFAVQVQEITLLQKVVALLIQLKNFLIK
jgi:murein DD-endopeptidase MepM/ murein hydrolase activator NlpD